MKESFPTSSQESTREDWRIVKENAPKDAAKIIEEISGYKSMTLEMKVETLRGEMERLKVENDNRFIAEELANEIKRQELMDAIKKGKEELAKYKRSEAANDEEFEQAA